MNIKRLATLVLFAVTAAALTVAVRAQAPPSQLGLTEQDARQNLLESLSSGFPVFGGAAKAFSALPASARAAVVNASFVWMKAVVNSTPFKTAYAQARENAKPTPPEFDGTVDDELKRKQEDQAKQGEEAKAMMALIPAAQRAEMENMLRQNEALMKTPQMVETMRQQIVADRATAQESYQNDLKAWQERYPANPLVLVRRRLQAFLDASADVDFAAKTETRDGKIRFVNPAYEAKPGDWKLCFRAGREAVTAARTAASTWIGELPQQ